MDKNQYKNKQTKKRPAFRHCKNSRGMKLLYHPSTLIKMGKYAGKTFGYVLTYYGKKAFPELLKYYRICARIMDEYHCTLRPHVDKPQEVSPAPVPNDTAVWMEEEDMVATTVNDQIDKVVDSCDALDKTDRVEIDDNKWKSSRSDYENNVLYDPEDDVPDSYLDDFLAAVA